MNIIYPPRPFTNVLIVSGPLYFVLGPIIVSSLFPPWGPLIITGPFVTFSRPFPSDENRDYYNDPSSSGEDIYASLQDVSA